MGRVLTESQDLSALEAKLAAQKAQLGDLAIMGTVITSIHEMDAVLSVVMDMAIQLVGGEVGILMIHENDKLKSRIAWGVDESFVRALKYKEGVDIATYCFEHSSPILLPDLNVESEQGIRVQSVLAMPLKTHDKCLGVIIIINKTDGSNHTDDDQNVLDMLLNFVAVAVDNAALVKEQLKQQKSEQEMAIAKQVQETILPDRIKGMPGADIGAVYFPAGEVSGDFYDVVPITDKKFMVMLGDVSSKGVPAALVMSATSGILKSQLAYSPDISVSELATRLNNVLTRGIIRDREMFVTLFLAKFDLEDGILTYCNGGHMPGLFWDNHLKRIVELPIGGPIVGQFEDIPFKEGHRKISPGDRLFLFTDGLTEAQDDNDRLFGRERVEQVFASEINSEPYEFCLKVKEWVDRFTVGSSEESQDDFTILQVKVTEI